QSRTSRCSEVDVEAGEPRTRSAGSRIGLRRAVVVDDDGVCAVGAERPLDLRLSRSVAGFVGHEVEPDLVLRVCECGRVAPDGSLDVLVVRPGLVVVACEHMSMGAELTV